MTQDRDDRLGAAREAVETYLQNQGPAWVLAACVRRTAEEAREAAIEGAGGEGTRGPGTPAAPETDLLQRLRVRRMWSAWEQPQGPLWAERVQALRDAEGLIARVVGLSREPPAGAPGAGTRR